MTIPRRILNIAVTNALTTSTGRPITLMEADTTVAPDKAADMAPYAFLEPLPGAEYLMTLARAYPLAKYSYAAISCGLNTEQAEAMADRVRDRLLNLQANPIEIAGYNVVDAVP